MLSDQVFPPVSDAAGEAAAQEARAEQGDGAERRTCGCIAEVADVDAANKLAELISKEPNRFLAGYMMGVLDTYHGLPRSYAWYGICGNSTPEEFRQFDIAETVRCKKAAANLLDWHKQHANKLLTQRIDAALDVWDKRIVETLRSRFSITDRIK